MAKYALKADTPLDSAAASFDGIALEEVSARSIVSVAIANGREAALRTAVKTAYGTDLPSVGGTTSAGDMLILGLARDQFWFMFEHAAETPEQTVSALLGRHDGYFVDQSDGWAVVRLSGPRCRDALERICPLDLHSEKFHIGHVTRTVMEHLAVIIHREADDSFLLLSPRSSAHSFWHALDVSARNVS